MPVFPVESLDDPRIEIYRNLRSTNRTRDLGMMAVSYTHLTLPTSDLV